MASGAELKLRDLHSWLRCELDSETRRTHCHFFWRREAYKKSRLRFPISPIQESEKPISPIKPISRALSLSVLSVLLSSVRNEWLPFSPRRFEKSGRDCIFAGLVETRFAPRLPCSVCANTRPQLLLRFIRRSYFPCLNVEAIKAL